MVDALARGKVALHLLASTVQGTKQPLCGYPASLAVGVEIQATAWFFLCAARPQSMLCAHLQQVRGRRASSFGLVKLSFASSTCFRFATSFASLILLCSII